MLSTLTLGASDYGEIIPIVGIVFGCLVAIAAIVSGAVGATRRSRHREESRREIAAYVAEGTMNVETAERLMVAGVKEDMERSKQCD